MTCSALQSLDRSRITAVDEDWRSSFCLVVTSFFPWPFFYRINQGALFLLFSFFRTNEETFFFFPLPSFYERPRARRGPPRELNGKGCNICTYRGKERHTETGRKNTSTKKHKYITSRTRAGKKYLTDENCRGRRSAEPTNRLNKKGYVESENGP